MVYNPNNSVNPSWQYDNKINTYFKRVLNGLTNPNYCKEKYGFDYPWWSKNSIFNPVLFALIYYITVIAIIFFIVSLIPPVSAGQTVNNSVTIGNVTDTTIAFIVSYNTDERAEGATLDGVEITGFDTQHNVTYVAKELEPNSTHTFCIFNTLINCETATTTFTKSSSDNILDYFWKWLPLIAVIILIFVGVYIPMFELIAFIFALLGFLASINSHDFYFFVIWSCCLLASFFVGYKGINGEL